MNNNAPYTILVSWIGSADLYALKKQEEIVVLDEKRSGPFIRLLNFCNNENLFPDEILILWDDYPIREGQIDFERYRSFIQDKFFSRDEQKIKTMNVKKELKENKTISTLTSCAVDKISNRIDELTKSETVTDKSFRIIYNLSSGQPQMGHSLVYGGAYIEYEYNDIVEESRYFASALPEVLNNIPSGVEEVEKDIKLGKHKIGIIQNIWKNLTSIPEGKMDEDPINLLKSSKSKEIQEIVERIEEYILLYGVTHKFPILLIGETGTGKEIIAKAIYQGLMKRAKEGEFLKKREEHPRYMAFNVSAIPETLIEDTLFGHEKGAYTGAYKEKKGYFELAKNGVLFLDEISDMPLSMQAKLLRVLQEKSFHRLGGDIDIAMENVTIIAAANSSIFEKLHTGEFRKDLFYRISTRIIKVPTLTERGNQDIESIAAYLIENYNRDKKLNEKILPGEEPNIILTDDGKKQLAQYTWPGNIRELEHIIGLLWMDAINAYIRTRNVVYIDAKVVDDAISQRNISKTYLQDLNIEQFTHKLAVDLFHFLISKEKMDYRTLDENLKRELIKYFKRNGYTQIQVANILGYSVKQIGNILQKGSEPRSNKKPGRKPRAASKKGPAKEKD